MDFLMKWMWQLIASGVIVLGGVSACTLRDASIENRGGEKRQAKIEKATTNATNLGKRAASKSTTAGVRGPVDPTSRDD